MSTTTILCAPTPDFPPALHGLLEAEAYPHAVTQLRLIQTHVSWILLTGHYAYKLKRRVTYPFLDLSSPRMRELCCREEVRLNGRFSSGLYGRVVPIVLTAAGLRVGGSGQIVEYAVQMAQFDPEEVLDRLLARDIPLEELAAFGRSMAAIHATLPRVAPDRPWGTPVAVGEQVLQNVAELLALAPQGEARARIVQLQANLCLHLKGAVAALRARRESGAVRECHGDLHARNVVRWQGRLVAFDGMEFDAALRWIDVAREVALLDVDLRARGYDRAAHAMLQGWFDGSADYGACTVLDLYRAHGALVRAKVSLLNPADEARVPGYLTAAETALAPRPVTLVLVCGLSGSGKTSLAHELAPLIDAVHLRSDLERKRMSGLDELEHSGSGLRADLYSPRMTATLYARLVELTTLVLVGRQSVVVDATFLLASQRREFTALAHRQACRIQVVWCEAPHDVLCKRVAQRQQDGNDASEADLRVLASQQDHCEMPTSDEAPLLQVSTLEASPELARRIANGLRA